MVGPLVAGCRRRGRHGDGRWFGNGRAGGTGHTVTTTAHQHGTFTDAQATNPCTGAPGVATFVGNSVVHETFFPDGDEVWATFTETGRSPPPGTG